MEKNELIRHLASDDEDKLLLGRVMDKMDACRRKNIPASTRFLTVHQQELAKRLIAACGNPSCAFVGGYEEAERVCLVFLPDWMEEPPTDSDSPIACLRCGFAADKPPAHRDILGALMGCGLTRDTVGDILISPAFADVVIVREMLPYVLQNLESAGRAHLSVAELPQGELTVPPEAFTMKRDTVSSLRLDSLVSSGFNLSREKAAELIRCGKVSLDGMECLKPDKPVVEGCTVSARGFGKIKLQEVGGRTKKDRISINIKKYI